MACPALSPTSGGLYNLPLELLQMIVQVLDLESTQNFKMVNRYAKAVVESCRKYQVSVAKAHHLICAIHNFGAASLFTVLDVFNAVGSNSCCVCKGRRR